MVLYSSLPGFMSIQGLKLGTFSGPSAYRGKSSVLTSTPSCEEDEVSNDVSWILQSQLSAVRIATGPISSLQKRMQVSCSVSYFVPLVRDTTVVASYAAESPDFSADTRSVA